MCFSGKYLLDYHHNFEPFMKAIGLSDELIQKRKDLKSIVEIVQDGKKFKITVTTGNALTINEFTIGEECEMIIPTGEKVKVVVSKEGDNKLVTNVGDITSVIELKGDLLINILTKGQLQYLRISKRI